MHQLIYTSCRAGQSVDGRSGYTVRAASKGLDRNWQRLAPQLARFDLQGASVQPKHGPVRMAYLRVGDASVLVHTVPVIDHERRLATRTYALIDVDRASLSPAVATAAWGSVLWEQAAAEASIELPQVEQASVGPLSWQVAQQRMGDARFAAMMEFLITAWAAKSRQPLVLLAEPEDVALGVWLLARAMPCGLLRDFTFATCDHDPASAATLVTGFAGSAAALRSSQKPLAWFELASAASSGSSKSGYAPWAVQHILRGEWSGVESFIALAEDLELASGAALELLHRVKHESHAVGADDLPVLESAPNLLRWLLKDSAQAKRVGKLLAETAPSRQPAKALAATYLEDPQRADDFIHTTIERAAESIRSGDLRQANYWMDMAFQDARRGSPASIWADLADAIQGHAICAHARAWIADNLLEGKPTPAIRAKAEAILAVDDLAELLHLQVELEVKVIACKVAVQRQQALSLEVVYELACQAPLLHGVFLAIEDPAALAMAVAAHHLPQVLMLLASQPSLRTMIQPQAVLAYAVGSGVAGLEQLAHPAFEPTWRLVLATTFREQFAQSLLDAPLSTGLQTNAKAIQAALAQAPHLCEPLQHKLSRRLALICALSGQLGSAPIADVIAGIAELPDAGRAKTFTALLPALAAATCQSSDRYIAAYVDAILNLAERHHDVSRSRVLQDLVKGAQRHGRLFRAPRLARLLLEFAFGANHAVAIGADRDRMLDLGRELLCLCRRAGGRTLNRDLDAAAARWPEPARSFFRLVTHDHPVRGNLRAFLTRRRHQTSASFA